MSRRASSSTDASSTDTSSSASSSDSASDEPRTDSEEAEHEKNVAYQQHESKLASIAARHIQLPHLDRALSHAATAIKAAIESGELTAERLDSWTDSEWNELFASIAKQNEHIAVPLQKPKLPSVKHRRSY